MLIASFLAVFSLIAMRNWIVAGVARRSYRGRITLLGGNEPPPGLTIEPGARAPSINDSASAISPPP